MEREPSPLGNLHFVYLTERVDPQIFDYVLVQSIHNAIVNRLYQNVVSATFANELPPTFLEQARDLANWHEYYVFGSPDSKSIGTSAYNLLSACLYPRT